jgi:hypothetical protein
MLTHSPPQSQLAALLLAPFAVVRTFREFIGAAEEETTVARPAPK